MSIGLRAESFCKAEPIYQLGHVNFSVVNCDSKFEEALEKLLPHYDGAPLLPGFVHALNSGCTKQVLAVVLHIINLHHAQKCVWLEGSCLISPAGHKVLMTGKSQSGKSTTSTGLALGHGWRILSENVCLIDYQANQLLKFLSPISFDERSLKILQRCLGFRPEPTFSLEWRKNRVWAAVKDQVGVATYTPEFDLAVWLNKRDENDNELLLEDMSAVEFGRKTLSISNLLKINGASESFIESLKSARCLALSGGELEQRLDVITNAVMQIPKNRHSRA